MSPAGTALLQMTGILTGELTRNCNIETRKLKSDDLERRLLTWNK